MNREESKKPRLLKLGISAAIIGAIGIGGIVAGVTTASAASPIDYATQVQPIFNASCSCHIASAQAGVQLNNYTNAHASAGKLPGMGSRYLTAAQLQIISDWKSQGALQTPPVVTPPVTTPPPTTPPPSTPPPTVPPPTTPLPTTPPPALKQHGDDKGSSHGEHEDSEKTRHGDNSGRGESNGGERD